MGCIRKQGKTVRKNSAHDFDDEITECERESNLQRASILGGGG
jgi:hypothetical protein